MKKQSLKKNELLSVLGVCFFIRCWNNLKSRATSLFDVRCSMFDVGRSYFKTTPYGINAICECLQNNLVLMGSEDRA